MFKLIEIGGKNRLAAILQTANNNYIDHNQRKTLAQDRSYSVKYLLKEISLYFKNHEREETMNVQNY